MKSFVAVAVLLLAAWSPPAAAQQLVGVTLTITDLTTPIPYDGEAQLPVRVNVGCLDAQADNSVVVAVNGTPPAWLTVTPATITVGADQGCVPGGVVSRSGNLTLAVSKDAPGVVPHTLNLTATVNSKSASDSTTFTVEYFSDYTLEPMVTFPLNVTNKTTPFQVVGTQRSNARSMIMVDGSLEATNGALVSGIASQQYLNEAGQPYSFTYNVTFTAPSGDWDNSTIKFRTFGHYNFPGFEGGDPTDYRNWTWQVNNGDHGDHEQDEGGGGGDKGLIPGPSGSLVALALVAVAVLLRRRA